jgi:hypothetical protein
VASGARTSSPPPIQYPSPTANWKSYTGAKWGYSISYPASWYSLDIAGVPDTQKYFSNEQVRVPSELDLSGIWLTIAISGKTGDQCLNRHLWNAKIDNTFALTVDKAPVNLVATNEGGMPALVANALRGAYCHSVTFLFMTVQLRDQTAATAQSMLSQSYQFGQPTAQPPQTDP